MIWAQAYIDDNLMQPLSGGNTLTHAAICGHDGGIWAESANFPGISDTELEAIMKGFEDSSHLATNGLYLGGEKYMILAGEPGEVLRGKKGQNGITIAKTASALIIGIYGEGVTPAECNVVSCCFIKFFGGIVSLK